MAIRVLTTGVPSDVPGSEPATIQRLVDTDVELGGAIAMTGESHLDLLDAIHRRALAGVLREALSNARRHVPGLKPCG